MVPIAFTHIALDHIALDQFSLARLGRPPAEVRMLGCGVRPPLGLGIKAVVESYVVYSYVGECYGNREIRITKEDVLFFLGGRKMVLHSVRAELIFR